MPVADSKGPRGRPLPYMAILRFVLQLFIFAEAVGGESDWVEAWQFSSILGIGLLQIMQRTEGTDEAFASV
jgi:hypothetical protein